jgi:hypothetical protein
VYDVRLLEALRRISALEHERLQANRALNDVIARSLELERRLADTQAALEHSRAAFTTYLRAEIARLTIENDDIARRLAPLQSSLFWRIGVSIRSARARLRKRA